MTLQGCRNARFSKYQRLPARRHCFALLDAVPVPPGLQDSYMYQKLPAEVIAVMSPQLLLERRGVANWAFAPGQAGP